MSREYFLAYHSYLEILEELSDAECGRLFRASLEYSQAGKMPELRGNERFLFPTIKNQIDRDNKRYTEKCESNRENGKYGILGGRPKKSETHEKPSGFLETLREGKGKSKGDKKEKTSNEGKKKSAYGEFKNVLLTSNEVEKLRERLGKEFENLLEEMSSGIAAKGYKYKDHYAALLNWSKRKKSNEGGTKNGIGRSVNTDFEGKPKINKYPNSTQYDDSWFKK